MDPSSRHELWATFVQARSFGRCVIFTTHYLEEADVLADRKAVLARGQVRAIGTSQELKKHFGTGYHLAVEYASDAAADAEQQTFALVAEHVAEAVREEGRQGVHAADKARSATFTLPYSTVSKFGPLLEELDAKKSERGITSYTLGMTTLEEVFMRLGREAEMESSSSRPNVDFAEVTQDVALNFEELQVNRSTSRSVWALARVILRAHSKPSSLGTVVVLPAFLMVCGMLLSGLGAPTIGSNRANGYAIVLYPSLAFAVSLTSFSVELVKQRVGKVQIVSLCHGLGIRAYIGAHLLAHLLLFLVPISTFVLLFFIMRPPAIPPGATMLPIVMACILPVTNLLMAYTFGALFQTKENASKGVSIFFACGGLLPPMIMSSILQMEAARSIAFVLHVICSAALPMYGLSGTIVYLNTKYAFHYPVESWRLEDESGNEMVVWTPEDGVFDLGRALTSEAAVPLLFAPVHLAMLTWILMRLMRGSSRSGKVEVCDGSHKDGDVLAEERRIAEAPLGGDSSQEAVMYKGLFHTYRSRVKWLPPTWKETQAIRGISLGIRNGECFGLLGPNGAGKTSTLGVLTGEVNPPTAGQVMVGGQDVGTAAGLQAARRLLSICPQEDPLWELISGRDHLIYHSRLKGVAEADIEETVDTLLARLGLEPSDARKRAGTYSGGMKRKLSVGIALVGHSPVLFMDEPSAAVDAGAKRHLWEVIQKRGVGQTVVLTTHSMEEAEALCDRLAIQVRGQLRCLGSPMHIKERYSSGYQLDLFAKHSEAGAGGPDQAAGQAPGASAMSAFVSEHVSSEARLLEQVGGRYVFQLPAPGQAGAVPLSLVFRKVELMKATLGIEDFSVTQPSLEQVFLRFAKEQHEAELALEKGS